MNAIQSITVVEDVTLISLHDSPADITMISKIFAMISEAGIDVDMISQTPPHRNIPDLSFTIAGDDFGNLFTSSGIESRFEAFYQQRALQDFRIR